MCSIMNERNIVSGSFAIEASFMMKSSTKQFICKQEQKGNWNFWFTVVVYVLGFGTGF